MSLAPFATWFTPETGMSASDINTEIRGLYARQKAIDAMLNGELDEDSLYDLLMEHCIEPEEWAETAIQNISFLMGERF